MSEIANNEIEKIRNKTFTSELKDLVNDVSGISSEDDLSGIDKHELLENFHNLFYRSVNLPFSDNCVASNNFIEDNSFNDLISELKSEFNIDNFATMEYDLTSRVYKITNSNFETKLNNSFVFSPNETIYDTILGSENPIHFNYSTIKNLKLKDYYLSFSMYNFHMISFTAIALKYFQNYIKFHDSFDSIKLSPVFLFKMDAISDFNQFLEKKYSSFIFTLFNYFIKKQNKNTDISLNYDSILEKYVTEISKLKKSHCYVIKINKKFNSEFYFSFKYFIKKIQNMFLDPSRFIMIDYKKSVIFVSGQDTHSFFSKIEEYNSSNEKPLELIQLNDFSKINLYSFIKQMK